MYYKYYCLGNLGELRKDGCSEIVMLVVALKYIWKNL